MKNILNSGALIAPFTIYGIILVINYYLSGSLNFSPTYLVSHLCILIKLIDYRIYNKNNKKNSKVKQWLIAIWYRTGWGLCYNFYCTGKFGGENPQMLFYTGIQCVIACYIYTNIPMSTIEYLWDLKIFRLFIILVDQVICTSLSFFSIYFVQYSKNGQSGLIAPMVALGSRPLSSMCSSIFFAILNKNLTKQYFKRLINSFKIKLIRTLYLVLVNHFWFTTKYEGSSLNMPNETILLNINKAYYALVGYIQFLQSYEGEKNSQQSITDN